MANTSNNQGVPETKGSTHGATAADRTDPAVQPPIDPSLNDQTVHDGSDAKGGKPKNQTT